MELAGLPPAKQVWDVAPRIQIEGTWQAYWSSRDKKWRHNIERCGRRLAERGTVGLRALSARGHRRRRRRSPLGPVRRLRRGRPAKLAERRDDGTTLSSPGGLRSTSARPMRRPPGPAASMSTSCCWTAGRWPSSTTTSTTAASTGCGRDSIRSSRQFRPGLVLETKDGGRRFSPRRPLLRLGRGVAGRSSGRGRPTWPPVTASRISPRGFPRAVAAAEAMAHRADQGASQVPPGGRAVSSGVTYEGTRSCLGLRYGFSPLGCPSPAVLANKAWTTW